MKTIKKFFVGIILLLLSIYLGYLAGETLPGNKLAMILSPIIMNCLLYRWFAMGKYISLGFVAILSAMGGAIWMLISFFLAPPELGIFAHIVQFYWAVCFYLHTFSNL